MTDTAAAKSTTFEAPYPGSKAMPRWDTGELIDAPVVTWKNILAMIGPGLVMGAAAIGGGEWLAGPAVTAKYGGALLWVATISIVFQVIYNIEISRYALYTGEPIFTGKFRTLPHPVVWLIVYLLLDWGSVAPYLVVNAAVPLESLMLQRKPDIENIPWDWWFHKFVCTGLYMLIMVPLIFGGKVYDSLKVVMSAKLVIIVGFLLFVGVLFARPASWVEIFSGFVKIGTVPIVVEAPKTPPPPLAPGEPAANAPGSAIKNTENVFVTLATEGRFPELDWTLVAMIAGLAAIAGNGGLTNTPISNFTRDQGWGMGAKVGAIPSVIGGHGITLSHVGCVFDVNEESLPRWKGWYRHIVRDQVFVWMAACFIGVALPSILSVGFLPRGTNVDQYTVAALTADAVRQQGIEPMSGTLVTATGLDKVIAGPNLGAAFWSMTLFCGFLVLITSQTTTMDGFTRRWVDVMWTALPPLRKLESDKVKYVYFSLLVVYASIGLVIIWVTEKPGFVFQLATTGYNFAFAFSAWHTLAVNTLLLPKELRPGWPQRAGLVLAGVFFLGLGTMSALKLAQVIK